MPSYDRPIIIDKVKLHMKSIGLFISTSTAISIISLMYFSAPWIWVFLFLTVLSFLLTSQSRCWHDLKTAESCNASCKKHICSCSVSTCAVFWFRFYLIERIHYSMLEFERWMLDVHLSWSWFIPYRLIFSYYAIRQKENADTSPEGPFICVFLNAFWSRDQLLFKSKSSTFDTV